MIDLFVGQWLTFLLVLVRIVGMFSTAPFWSGEGAPMKIKVALALAVAIGIFPDIAARGVLPVTFASPWQFAGAVAEQAVIGMIIGFISAMFFVLFDASGRFYSTQMGLGIINVFDPFHAVEVSIMGQFQSFISLLLFIAVDGPQWMLFAVQKSFLVAPHFQPTSLALAHAIFGLFSKIFYISFVFVMPILGVLFLSHVVLGILSKASPQLNVMILGFPINIGVGLFTFILLLDYFENMIPEIFETMFREIDLFLVHLL
ncbi:flagellar biosynthetic protein FliR [bacterium]|nr:flagellar biosynthetic protein FliR [bacterium]